MFTVKNCRPHQWLDEYDNNKGAKSGKSFFKRFMRRTMRHKNKQWIKTIE